VFVFESCKAIRFYLRVNGHYGLKFLLYMMYKCVLSNLLLCRTLFYNLVRWRNPKVPYRIQRDTSLQTQHNLKYELTKIKEAVIVALELLRTQITATFWCVFGIFLRYSKMLMNPTDARLALTMFNGTLVGKRWRKRWEELEFSRRRADWVRHMMQDLSIPYNLLLPKIPYVFFCA